MTDTPTIGLGKLLKENKKFSVPPHQRDFSWSEDEIEQFFIDVLEARRLNQKDYFLGLMVFMPGANESEYIVLDGQQRIATASIILSSIRSWLSSYGFNDEEAQIQSEFIGVKDYGEKDLKPRVELNYNNNELFYQHVVNETPVKDLELILKSLNKNHHNYRLTKAIIFTRSKIDELFNASTISKESASKDIFDFLKFIRDNVKIVKLTVENEANAYTVFETLNDRGLALSSLDLIKNHLFGKANNPLVLNQIQRKWIQMMTHLQSVKSEDFLKTYWTSRNGRIQVPKIFPAFKKTVRNSQNADDIVSDMLLSAEQFSAIYIADHPFWSKYSKKVKIRMKSLGVLNSKQLPPIILSALLRFNEKEFEKLLWLLEVLIVRFQLIVGGRTGVLEIACNRLAKKIFDGEVSRTSHAKNEFRQIMPSDSEFHEYFSLKSETTSRKVVYIFSKLENQIRIDRGKGGEIDISESITVEHILPKNPNQNWSNFQNDPIRQIDDYKFRLGNLCLLSHQSHKSGAKAFSDKKTDYSPSELMLTKELIEYDDWTFNNIEKRQIKLADLAVKAWNL